MIEESALLALNQWLLFEILDYLFFRVGKVGLGLDPLVLDGHSVIEPGRLLLIGESAKVLFFLVHHYQDLPRTPVLGDPTVL